MFIMKMLASFAALGLLVATCTNTAKTSVGNAPEQTIEYQVGESEYTVVVVQAEGVSRAQAAQFAKQRAAEIAFENGYSYIVITSEQEVKVVKSDRPFPDNQAFYGNMYQELIVEGDFNRERLARSTVPNENIYPAYRLTFKAYDTKPGWKGIDVCTLTECQ